MSNDVFIQDKNNKKYLLIDKNKIMSVFKDEHNYFVTRTDNLKDNTLQDLSKISSFETLMPAVALYERYSMPIKEQVESLTKSLDEVDNKALVFSILEHENWSNETNNVDLKVLNCIYNDFTDNDYMSLLSDGIKGLEDKYAYKRLENIVIDHLKENGVDPTLISNDRLNELYDDLLEEATTTDTDIDTLVEYSDYLNGAIDEFLKQQEDEEEDEL